MDHAVGGVVRERVHEQSVDDAENRRRRPNAERQRNHGRQRQPRPLPPLATGELQILEESSHGALLTSKTQNQEREQGTARRIIRRSTAGTSQACASPSSKCFATFNLREASNPSLWWCARSRKSPSQERTGTPAARGVSSGALSGGPGLAPGNDIDLQRGIGRWHIGSCQAQFAPHDVTALGDGAGFVEGNFAVAALAPEPAVA